MQDFVGSTSRLTFLTLRDLDSVFNASVSFLAPDPFVLFESLDTLGFAAGLSNLFSYTGNSPLNFVDPTGNATAVETTILNLKIAAAGCVVGRTARVVGNIQGQKITLTEAFFIGAIFKLLDAVLKDAAAATAAESAAAAGSSVVVRYTIVFSVGFLACFKG